MKKIKKKKQSINFEIDLRGIRFIDIMLLTKHLNVALKSGFTLIEGFAMLHDQASGKLKKVLGEILRSLQTGQPLYKALENYPKYFSALYVKMVKTGEMAGTLVENLAYLSGQLNKSHRMKQKVKGAMMYPMLVFIAVVGLGLSVAIFVLPQILPLFKSLNVELPLTTQGLLFVAEIFSEHGWSVMVWFVTSVIFMSWFLKRNFVKPFIHRIFLSWPVLKNIIIQINLQRFTLMFATLLGSGIAVDETLSIIAEATENRVYRKSIQSFIPAVQKGNSIAEAMEYYPKLYPKITSSLVGMGEKTGNLEQNLKYLSKYYESEVDNVLKNLSTILEPFMLIFIGVLVGTVAISILGPIYKISGSLRM